MSKKMKNLIFEYKKKKVSLTVKECKTMFSRMHGLMFKKNSPPLLFDFKKSVNIPIHSFFCKPFIAIWLDGKKIVDKKYIKPWRFYIKPKKKFDKLIEIPVGSKNFNLFSTKNSERFKYLT